MLWIIWLDLWSMLLSIDDDMNYMIEIVSYEFIDMMLWECTIGASLTIRDGRQMNVNHKLRVLCS